MALDNEIVEDFRSESEQLIAELNGVVESLESPGEEFPKELLEEFSQKIDRIMGACDTILTMDPEHKGLKRIGGISRICKSLGYAASQNPIPAAVPLFAAFWADTLEVMEELIENLEDEKASEEIAGDFSSVLQNRLEWLSDKVGHGKVKTVDEDGKAEKEGDMGQLDVDALLAEFDL